MYHTIVRRKVVGIFQALGRGDYEVALAGLAPRHGLSHGPEHRCCPFRDKVWRFQA